MTNIKVITALVLATFLALPVFAFADFQIFQGPLVPCGTSATQPCNACDFFVLIQNILNFLWTIAVSLAILFFIWGGFLMVTSPANPQMLEKGRTVLKNALIGILIVFVAWLGVDYIIKLVGGRFGTAPFGPWNQVQCTAPAGTIGPPPPGPTPPGPPPPGGPGSLQLSQANAMQQLQAGGVGLAGPIQLEGIRQATVDEAIRLKQQCGCQVIITSATGGQHAEGTYSHANGYKIDLGLNNNLNSFITGNYPFVGIRSDGARMYRAPNGAVYALEGDHWDVVVIS